MTLKVRIKPILPVSITSGTGITVAYSGGVYTVTWDIDSLAEISSITSSDRDNLLFPVYNEDTAVYSNIALDTLLTSISAGLDDTLVSIAALNPTTNESIYFTATNTAAVFTTTAGGRALIGVTGATDTLPYYSGASSATSTSLTSYARTLLDDTTAALARGTLGLATTTTDNAIIRADGTTGGTQTSIALIDDNGCICPVTTDIGSLGTAGLNWSDLFLDSGSVINFDAGDVTITHSANTLQVQGGTFVVDIVDINGGSADGLTSFGIRSSGAAFDLKVASTEVLTANHTLNVNLADGDRSVILAGNLTTGGHVTLVGSAAYVFRQSGATDITLPVSGTVATVSNTETFANKTLTTPILNTPDINGGTADQLASLSIRSSGSAFDLFLASSEVMTAARALNINLQDGARTITLGGNLTLGSHFVTTPANSVTLTTTGATSVTMPTAGTLAIKAGVTDGGSATAGDIGEYKETIVTSGSAVSVTSDTDTNIGAGVSLTAGDWEVSCTVYFIPAAGTSVTMLQSSTSSTTATRDITPGRFGSFTTAANVMGSVANGVDSGPTRFSLSGTATIFAVARATFTVSTMTAYSIIKAWRVR